MSSTNYNLIRQAILKRQQVIATYDGYRREMCPHVIGLKNNQEHALFYQFGGESSSGLEADLNANWRCMSIDKLADVQVRDGEWHSHSPHTQTQTCVGVIDVQVAEMPT